MKKYETIEVEIIELKIDDIITMSGPETDWQSNIGDLEQ